MKPPVLKTRRLILRPVAVDDAAAIRRGINNWDVVQWLTAPPFPYSLDDAHHFITQVIPTITSWAIDAGDGFIGTIGFAPDLGYWLDADYHGQRIMSEAAEAVVAWHFAQSEETLVSCHYLGNEPSRRVLQKQGFVDTDLEEQLQTATQENVTVQRMKLTRETWAARHG